MEFKERLQDSREVRTTSGNLDSTAGYVKESLEEHLWDTMGDHTLELTEGAPRERSMEEYLEEPI